MILAALALALQPCVPVATDGDTIRCGGERIRLLGIDAPERGRCPPRRRCAPGDPIASTDNLRRLVQSGPLTITRVGQDRYRRTLALVSVRGVDLSCAQLRGGFAIYRRDWDDGGRVRALCRTLTSN